MRGRSIVVSGQVIFGSGPKVRNYLAKRKRGLVWDKSGRPVCAWRIRNTRRARKIVRASR